MNETNRLIGEILQKNEQAYKTFFVDLSKAFGLDDKAIHGISLEWNQIMLNAKLQFLEALDLLYHKGYFKSFQRTTLDEIPIEHIYQSVQAGKTIADSLDLDSHGLVHVYELGAQFYQDQEFNESQKIFSFLTIVSPDVSSFWLSLANNLMVLERYKDASMAYVMAYALDPEFNSFYGICAALTELDHRHEVIQLIETDGLHFNESNQMSMLDELLEK